MPRTNSFYMSVLFGMKRGFEENGAEVITFCELLDKDSLLEFCNQYQPDVLFEMNRSRHEIPFLPKEVKHIAWIVDLPGHNPSYFQSSEITYYIVSSWSKNYQPDATHMVDWLPPGTSSHSYYHQNHTHKCDFSFLGHIPKPWTEEELNRPLFHSEDQQHVFSDFFKKISKLKNRQFIMKDIKTGGKKDLSSQIIKKTLNKEVEIADQTLRYDITIRTFRLLNRLDLANLALKHSNNLHLYGSNNWQDWSQFKNYYHHYVSNSNEIRRIYQTSKINLHDGLGLNFRLFDCMASGGVLAFNNTSKKNYFGNIDTFFEPYEHYLPINENNDEEIKDWLNNKELRDKISKSAAQEILEKHTWTIRTKKILNDIYEL